MLNAKQTFLTSPQVIDAIAADADQYGAQPGLFARIAPLILGDQFKSHDEDGSCHLYLRRGQGADYERVTPEALGFYLIYILETRAVGPDVLAPIASLVFEVAAIPGVMDDTAGIWIENQMTGFACRRCGQCCSDLATACTPEDVKLWHGLGRQDILAWVKARPLKTGEVQYRIWVDPETGLTAAACPFFRCARSGSYDQCRCAIEEIKPQVCRDYPFTRKHARQTGCPGFERGA